MLEQPKSIDKDSFVYHEDFYVDTYAQKAHSLKADAALTKAILTQQLIPDRTQRKSQPTQFLSSVCEKILKCKKHCPLMISGQPGTGKSTLLSLIYLNFIPPTESKKYIIDLHKFDNLNYGEAIGHLRSTIYREFLPKGEKTVQRDDWREYAQNSIQTFAPDLSFGYKLIEFLSKYTLRDDYFSE